MEQKGLELCLNYVSSRGLQVHTLVTDRHSQVKSYLKTKHPHIRHRFDVWHVAKGKIIMSLQPYHWGWLHHLIRWDWTVMPSFCLGIKKKIAAVSQSKRHQVLRLWCESIIRHLYWCARTSDTGELLVAKWTTIVRHVINVHSHPNSLHPACFHGDLGDREWLEEGTLHICPSGGNYLHWYLLKFYILGIASCFHVQMWKARRAWEQIIGIAYRMSQIKERSALQEQNATGIHL